jgi:hypothetical protein
MDLSDIGYIRRRDTVLQLYSLVTVQIPERTRQIMCDNYALGPKGTGLLSSTIHNFLKATALSLFPRNQGSCQDIVQSIQNDEEITRIGSSGRDGSHFNDAIERGANMSVGEVSYGCDRVACSAQRAMATHLG